MGKLKTWQIVVAIAAVVMAVILCCAIIVGVVLFDDLRGDRDEGTVWPRPVCTPPACGEEEVYHCPGECPGGCGTICVTPTPQR